MKRDGIPSDQKNVVNLWTRTTLDCFGSFRKIWAAIGAWMAAYAIARSLAPLKSVHPYLSVGAIGTAPFFGPIFGLKNSLLHGPG